MSEQNKVLVRRAYEEFYTKKNIKVVDKVVDEIIAPNFTDHTPPYGFPPGREGMKQEVAMFLKAFPDMRVTSEEMLAEGDTVMARFKVTGTHTGSFMGEAPSHKKFTYGGIECFRVKGGKITDVWRYSGGAMAMQEMGIKRPGT
jgi:hypothetical protein